MTSEVTQAALKPCPWCGTAEHLSVQWPGSMTADMPDCRCHVVCTHIDHDTVVGPTAYGKFAATTAWNARLTAKSGEQQSCEPIATVEMIETVTGDFYTEPGEPIWRVMVGEYCADFDSEQAARNFASAINLAAQSGEGRSGAGEDAEHLVRIFRGLPLHGDAGCDKLSDDEWRQVALAALNARQSGEGEREATLEAALWSVLSYDQLLRQYEGPQAILFAGDVEKIDATYDAMIAKVTAALRATDDAGGE